MDDKPPLAGIRVIDLTRYLAGPFATQLLGDYGADVIKIESPRGGRNQLGGDQAADSYFFLSTNRSKRSLALDYKSAQGHALLLRLLERADVVIDNFRPGVMEAIGFGYQELSGRNPRIISCSISGFGASGPLRDRPGFDQIAQGMSGLMSVTGDAQSGPTRVGIAICDLLAGIFAAQGILLALNARERTGRGQVVETSLLESILSVLSWSAGIFFESGKSPAAAGNHHPLSSPHGTFMASDRPFNIAVGNEAMWKNFGTVIGRPELSADPRFATLAGRLANREALTEAINQALAAQRADDWIEQLNRAGIPAGPILTLAEVFAHPQVSARQMLLEMPHPVRGIFKTTGLPVKLSDTPGRLCRPPLLGEHTDEVLAELGVEPEERARLRLAGVIK